jgi:ribosome maturation factor RimP
VRTRHPRPALAAGAADAAPRTARSFTGEVVGATEDEVTLAADGGVIAIPYSDIRRSNLIEE